MNIFNFKKKATYSEDMFADTRMTFGEHLADLQTHLWRAIAGFLVALVVSFFLGHAVLGLINAPLEKQLQLFYSNRAKNALRDLPNSKELQEANHPHCFKMAFNRDQFDAATKGKAIPELPDALPPNGKPLQLAELFSRAQLELAHAAEAAQTNRWGDLQEMAARLKITATSIGLASNVPEADRERIQALSTKLLAAADELAEAAKSKDADLAAKPLNSFIEMLGNNGMVEMWVRIAEPVAFAALMQPALAQVTKRPGLSTLSTQEAFMAYFKVCMATALVLGSPWIFWQVWLFVAAGLYPHEKRLIHVYLPISLGLFIIGVLVCQFLVMPKAIEALLWFNEWLGFEPDLRFNEWLGFAIMMPLVFGISFQLPLVMMFLERIGLVSIQAYFSKWKIAFFLIHVFAAVITPSVDVISMELLALPMFGLYGLGILLCKLNPHRTPVDFDVPESEELVEV
jgi:sec-independent protein translocase protein TatC